MDLYGRHGSLLGVAPAARAWGVGFCGNGKLCRHGGVMLRMGAVKREVETVYNKQHTHFTTTQGYPKLLSEVKRARLGILIPISYMVSSSSGAGRAILTAQRSTVLPSAFDARGTSGGRCHIEATKIAFAPPAQR